MLVLFVETLHRLWIWGSGCWFFLCFFDMAGVRDDSLQSITVQLTGHNYLCWSYVMQNFLKGKRMLCYVSGTYTKTTNGKDEGFAEQLNTWDASNSKIITWSTTRFINWSVFNWQNTRRLRRFRGIWKGCTHSLTLKSNVSWRSTFGS